MPNLRPISSKRNTSCNQSSAEASTSSNQVNSRLQASITCNPQIVTGVDKLKVSCWIDWRDHKVFKRLETHKKCLQDIPDKPKAPFDFIKSETIDNFNIHRTGTPKFQYRLTSGDITLLLAPRSFTSPLHNAQIEIGSLSCQEDAQGVYERVISMFNRLGGFKHKDVVQEIHLAVDLLGIPISNTYFHYENNWISQAGKFSYYSYRRKMTGICLGSGDIMFRSYDKIAEMKIKKESAKQDFFATKWRVDIENIDVTRCEFQLRRPVLKQFDVPTDTVEEVFSNLQPLWNYLSKKWARFCVAPVDLKNNNQSRSKISHHWEIIQKAIFTISSVIAKRDQKPIMKNTEALKELFRGVAMSLTAPKAFPSCNLEYIITTAQRIIKDELTIFYQKDEVEFNRRMQVRYDESYVTVL